MCTWTCLCMHVHVHCVYMWICVCMRFPNSSTGGVQWHPCPLRAWTLAPSPWSPPQPAHTVLMWFCWVLTSSALTCGAQVSPKGTVRTLDEQRTYKGSCHEHRVPERRGHEPGIAPSMPAVCSGPVLRPLFCCLAPAEPGFLSSQLVPLESANLLLESSDAPPVRAVPMLPSAQPLSHCPRRPAQLTRRHASV